MIRLAWRLRSASDVPYDHPQRWSTNSTSRGEMGHTCEGRGVSTVPLHLNLVHAEIGEGCLHELDRQGSRGQISNTSIRPSRCAKSSALRVQRGSPEADATAAINRSTARAPRALRPAAATAA